MVSHKIHKILQGIPSSPGVAIGPVFMLSDSFKIEAEIIDEKLVDEEIGKFKNALEKTKIELENLKIKALDALGEKHAEIFDSHILMLEDEEIIKATIDKIKTEKKSAEFSFYEVMTQYKDFLATSENEYFKERALDIRDVKRRVIRTIQGIDKTKSIEIVNPCIIVARDLTPSETMALDRKKILGFVTDWGGKTSHVSILARALEVPSIVGAKEAYENANPGDIIALDGNKGTVIINPTEEELEEYKERQHQYFEITRELSVLNNLPAETIDKKRIELSANVELPEELASAKAHGAKGIGLLRTEYLFLSEYQIPSEEEQYLEYKRIAEEVYPDSVIIRTLDLGGDKVAPNIKMSPEENPFLGWRAIRFCLDYPEIFKFQLRAILRASVKKNVRIMIPMVSGIEEIRVVKSILEETKNELRSKSVKFDENIELGIMIEVPSAAVIADILATEVDFLSIGTNDLTQYSLAVDRGNDKIAHLYQFLHPAILRLIKQTVIFGHRRKIWVGMCGEMASDPMSVPLLVGLELDELSVSPVLLPVVKRMIRSIKFSEAKKIAKRALELKTVEEIQEFMAGFILDRFPTLWGAETLH